MFDKDIDRAACLHTACMQEMAYIREAGYKTPVAVIPNPVIMQSDQDFSEKRNDRRIGFLGRLHPRKRVELLIYAFARLAHPDAELIIMGSGEDEYENFLKKEVSRLHIKNVVFTGMVSGEDKYGLLSSLSVLCVPSDFENFGMIVPEALMIKVPVMASLGTPWEDLRKYKCGWWIENKVETITGT